jgi:hypothetical protein
MKKSVYILVLVLFFYNIDIAFAQTPPPPDGGGGPGTVNDLPINFLVYPFLVFGAYLGYVFFKKPSK